MNSTDKNTIFTFDEKCDVVLVRVVDLSEANLATYSVSERWEEALVIFLASSEVSERIEERKSRYSGRRSLQESFKLILKKRRAYVKKKESP